MDGNTLNICIRVDSSQAIGSGHLMRCLTLADRLRDKGNSVSFISRQLPGNMIDFAEGKGYTTFRLPYVEAEFAALPIATHHQWLGTDWATDANQTLLALRGSAQIDWLIVDHYALDIHWEALMRPLVRRIMVIDDLADRPHDCDLLLDQNLYEDMASRYDGRVPEHCRKLLGPRYALLRPEFLEERQRLRARDGEVKRILMFFGGSDLCNETTKALEAWRLVNRPDIAVDVIVGGSNPHREQVRRICKIPAGRCANCPWP